MGADVGAGGPLEDRLAARLAELRTERGWSLDELSRRAGVSRSTLSRVERAEISPTTALLSSLCATYERTMSQLLAEVEPEVVRLIPAERQAVWRDEDAGFTRRSVSPPQPGLRGELVEVVLAAGADIRYEDTPIPGLEHHMWVLDGAVEVTVGGDRLIAAAGDCLRFRLWGGSRFRCHGTDSARYALMVVLP